MVADPAVFSRYAGAELLGLPQTGLELAAVLEDGVDFGKLQILSEALAVTPYELAASIHLSSSTLLRRKREGRLQADESDRLVRLGQIVAKAIQLFEGDREAAKIWLNRPARALGGRTPLKHTQTYSGAQEVEDLGQVRRRVRPRPRDQAQVDPGDEPVRVGEVLDRRGSGSDRQEQAHRDATSR